MISPVALVVAALVVASQTWVTVRLWRSALYSRGQKIGQSVLVWVLPVLGAAAVYAGLRQCDDVSRLPPNSDFGSVDDFPDDPGDHSV
jgi:hypothetical protein